MLVACEDQNFPTIWRSVEFGIPERGQSYWRLISKINTEQDGTDLKGPGIYQTYILS